MHRFSRAQPQEPETRETPPLSARSLALLFPARESHERVIKRDIGSKSNTNKSNEPLYDHDDTKTFPLSPHEEPRIIIAQDDTGVSIDRLLYDSQWTNKSRNHPDRTKEEAKTFFRPSSSARPATAGSGFLRPQESRKHRSTKSDLPDRPILSSQSSAFVPSTQLRRRPMPVSLADARHDPILPVEDSAEEMDSWLDCIFGKAPMQYKGALTKLHRLQRQPPDPLQEQQQKEAQRGGYTFSAETHSALPRSKRADLVKLRKDALLVSTTFAINVHDEDLPEQLQQPKSVHGARRMSSVRQKRFGTPMFGVAILLPLAKPCANLSYDKQEQDDEENDPTQAVIDNWHMYCRALDALKTIASNQIQQRLRARAEVLAQAQVASSLAGPRLVKLEPSAFELDSRIIDVSSAVLDRISRGSKVLKASPQRDWSIWRDEIRMYTRVAQDADSKRGMFNLNKINFIQASLTAALSTDLSWLSIFAPPQHQGRLREERRKLQSVFDSAQNRTVIVALDQNKARDLVFIFAKLFPCPPSELQFERSRRSSQNSLTSSSVRQISALTQGLRGVKRVPEEDHNENCMVDSGHTSASDTGRPNTALFEPSMQAISGTSPTKKSLPDAARKSGCLKVSGMIDIPGKATAAVLTSAPTSGRNTPSGSPEARPGTSANAHGELMRQLQRSGSSTVSVTSADTASIWNSLRSSTWSLKPRRDSSLTERSDSVGSSSQRDSQPSSILKTSKSFSARQSGSKLVRMVEEACNTEPDQQEDDGDANGYSRDHISAISPGMSCRTSALQFNPPTLDGVGMSYAYNQDEGVVDVEFPGFSPPENASHYFAARAPRFKVPSDKHQFPSHEPTYLGSESAPESQCVDGFAKYDRIAGYLDKFHPDFALQATKPSPDLVDEIKHAMRAEPTPTVEPSENLKVFSQESWVNICSTVLLDAEALTVKRLTLRRRVRYKLMVPDDTPTLPRHGISSNIKQHVPSSSANGSASETETQIKVIKSEDMDSIKRTYKRNDNGQKVGFRDKRITKADESFNDEMNNRVHGRHSVGTLERCTSPSSNAAKPRTPHSPKDSGILLAPSEDQDNSLKERANSFAVGEDLSAFIDRKTGGSSKTKTNTERSESFTRRVTIRNKEGKITGWKDVETDDASESGLNDLPTGFVEKRRDRAAAVIECQTLADAFDEEVITKPDSAVVSLLQQMLASTDTRSRVHSRANSIHSCVPSRSNSISGSGLSELQYESKKIIEDTLEGLVSAVAADKYNPASSATASGGIFAFARSATSTPEPSILRQSIHKWMFDDV